MTCVKNTDAVLGFAVGTMFVQETFRGESKTSVGLEFQIFNNLMNFVFSNNDPTSEEFM